MKQVRATVIENRDLGAAGYFLLTIEAPEVAGAVRPGQFLHLKIPSFEHRLLRRPFSIFRAEDGRIGVLYKTVGEGTRALSRVPPGTSLDIIAPLGTPYRVPDAETTPVLVAGGYGAAALYLLAAASPRRGILCIGGRSAEDILGVDDFTRLGFDIEIRTEDGSLGERGVVTESLEEILDRGIRRPAIYACGPKPMLQRVSEIARERAVPAQISLDHRLCCGVGACLTCVAKIRTGPDRWEYRRVCREGPVFDAQEIVW